MKTLIQANIHITKGQPYTETLGSIVTEKIIREQIKGYKQSQHSQVI